MESEVCFPQAHEQASMEPRKTIEEKAREEGYTFTPLSPYLLHSDTKAREEGYTPARYQSLTGESESGASTARTGGSSSFRLDEAGKAEMKERMLSKMEAQSLTPPGSLNLNLSQLQETEPAAKRGAPFSEEIPVLKTEKTREATPPPLLPLRSPRSLSPLRHYPSPRPIIPDSPKMLEAAEQELEAAVSEAEAASAEREEQEEMARHDEDQGLEIEHDTVQEKTVEEAHEEKETVPKEAEEEVDHDAALKAAALSAEEQLESIRGTMDDAKFQELLKLVTLAKGRP